MKTINKSNPRSFTSPSPPSNNNLIKSPKIPNSPRNTIQSPRTKTSNNSNNSNNSNGLNNSSSLNLQEKKKKNENNQKINLDSYISNVLSQEHSQLIMEGRISKAGKYVF